MPFVTHPATLPHPDRRALLILFAAQQRGSDRWPEWTRLTAAGGDGANCACSPDPLAFRDQRNRPDGIGEQCRSDPHTHSYDEYDCGRNNGNKPVHGAP